MKKLTSVKQICERLFTLEKEHDLLNYDVGGVKIWQLLRMSIYYDIAVATGVLSAPHPEQEKLSRFHRILASLRNLIFRNPLLTWGPVDAVVISHPRKVEDHGKLLDVYTHFLVEQLEEKEQRYVILEKTERFASSGPMARRTFCADAFLWLSKFNSFFDKADCSEKEIEAIIQLERLLNGTFDLSLDFTTKLSTQLQRFRLYYRHFRILLNRLQPKSIYVVVAYFDWGALIKAAKELGIEVIEIQHGVFSRYHLGYSYPGLTEALDYFPDKLLTWGRYWSDMQELPLPNSARIEYGFEYFHRKQEQVLGTEKRSNQILVLSQGAVGKRLAETLSDLAGQLSDYRIVYKLHPSEYRKWRQQEILCRLAAMPNVTMAAEDSDLYRLFAESEYQFGVFSTAIFEGAGMGCKTVLLDLPGVEYMQKMIDKGFCVKFADNTDIHKALAVADKIDITAAAEQLFGAHRS